MMTNLKSESNVKQKANKIINIDKAKKVIINHPPSDVKNVRRIYNKFFCKELMEHLKNEKEFPHKFSFVENNDWIDSTAQFNEAKLYISQSFIWVIGEEIRRMFVIGDQNNYTSEENRMTDYIDRSLRAYRSGLQLINYVFISKLLDEKIKGVKIHSSKQQIINFFTTERNLKLVDLRLLFQELIEVFNNSSELEFPFNKKEFGDIDLFLQSESSFNKACSSIESLLKVKGSEDGYTYEHCETAEKSLAIFLSKLIILTKYQLVSVKHIEYEESRNNAPQYIKEMRIIKLPSISKKQEENSDAMENLIHTLMYDETPQKTNSVLFHKKDGYVKNSINLFPFLIDKNALDDQPEFDLYYYEHLNTEERKLRYYSTKNKDQDISYKKARILTSDELKEKNALEKFIIATRLELVSNQFQLARNIILNDDFSFSDMNNVMLK